MIERTLIQEEGPIQIQASQSQFTNEKESTEITKRKPHFLPNTPLPTILFTGIPPLPPPLYVPRVEMKYDKITGGQVVVFD
jgi:hypothetical protein